MDYLGDELRASRRKGRIWRRKFGSADGICRSIFEEESEQGRDAVKQEGDDEQNDDEENDEASAHNERCSKARR